MIVVIYFPVMYVGVNLWYNDEKTIHTRSRNNSLDVDSYSIYEWGKSGIKCIVIAKTGQAQDWWRQ